MPDTNNTNTDSEEYEEIYQCSECSFDTTDIDDLVHSSYWGADVCQSCYDDGLEREAESEDDGESDFIHYHSYKPRALFFNDDGCASYYVAREPESGFPQLYLGMELEVEFEGSRRWSREDGAQMLVRTYADKNDPIYLKTDGSLNHGFEIVSHPGTLGYFTQRFDWEPIKKLAGMGFKAWNNSHCGLHIHMSRAAFQSDHHLFMFIKFIFDNRDALVQFAGRESSYAKFGIENLLNVYWDYDRNEQVRSNKLMDLVKGYVSNADRYTAVNLQNTHTIELRFFRPSLKPSTVVAALEFCDASFRYANTLTVQDATLRNGLAFNSFRSWLDTRQSPSYPTLRERIVERLGALNSDE